MKIPCVKGENLLSPQPITIAGYTVQIASRIGWIVDNRQCVQITTVGLERDLTIAEQIGDPFAHRDSVGLTLAFARDCLTHPEFLGIVDNDFDPKNETRGVIPLESVLFDTMLGSGSTVRRQTRLERSETISPSHLPCSLCPRKFMTPRQSTTCCG
jgi:hypothetical protein